MPKILIVAPSSPINAGGCRSNGRPSRVRPFPLARLDGEAGVGDLVDEDVVRAADTNQAQDQFGQPDETGLDRPIGADRVPTSRPIVGAGIPASDLSLDSARSSTGRCSASSSWHPQLGPVRFLEAPTALTAAASMAAESSTANSSATGETW